MLRSGGTLPWRMFNVGDLVSPLKDGKPAPRLTKGYIGFANPEDSEYHFFIFPDEATGRRELKANLLRMHGHKTIRKMVSDYAPKKDKRNNTEKYIRDLCQLAKVEESEVIKTLSVQRLESVMDGIMRIEGYHNEVDTRREQWVDVSHIQATDGTQPISDQEIMVLMGGKELSLKSNSVGQFPPIAHTNEKAEVHARDQKGQLKKIGEIPKGQSGRFNLFHKTDEFWGKTLPVKPPRASTSRKFPCQYVVQPGDDLDAISGLIGSPVDAIKRDNNLKRSVVFQGQVLSLHGASSSKSSLPRSKPKKARKVHPDASSKQASAPPAQPAPTQPAPAQPAPNKAPAKAVPEINTVQARSKEGKGEALALIPPQEGVAPWMKYALQEAVRFKGVDEVEIEKSMNYHTLIKDGISTIIGDKNAWCAAFVNWCLMQAGIPIKNPKETGYVDHIAAQARAHGFIELRGVREFPGQAYEKVKFIPNPLFQIIEEPVYGAIAIVVHPSGQGHHATFVYGKMNDERLCLLGGNQNGAINFANVAIKPVRPHKNQEGKEVGGIRDHLVFLLPRSYINPESNSSKHLKMQNAHEVNKFFGIKEKDGRNTR